ncbi:MAG: filamentous hemagglutinin N-terminal domain-containing protein, partial [Burkholderiaceae bacterium]|nr:filamentous hemagglutinin N-terminal domain-containing protein [Burkholderiaceae bacterium]
MKRHGSLNCIYRLVWSRVTNSWVAVAETTHGRGKGGGKSERRRLIAAALSLTAVTFAAPFAQAGPTGGQVVSGNGAITQSGSTTTIKQGSQNLSLNWNTFNIAASETVDFVQPSASAIAVNRIFDTNGSQILGHLDANGQVYLINPNGIVFGQGAQVNVGGLVASTLNISDSGLNGNARSFSGNGTGSIVNQGTINAASGGYVALLGNHVSNQGTVTAQLGTVGLGAGSAVTLTFNGNSLVHLQIDKSVLNSLAENGGLIRADGGTVIMSAGAADSLLASVVNNTGVIEARTVQNLGNEQTGTITLLGGMAAGTVNVNGTLDASAPNGGNGGFIETSAASVKVADATHLTTLAPNGLTGSWLIDPKDYTVQASGGDITGTALGSLLNSSNISINSASGASGTSGNV